MQANIFHTEFIDSAHTFSIVGGGLIVVAVATFIIECTVSVNTAGAVILLVVRYASLIGSPIALMAAISLYLQHYEALFGRDLTWLGIFPMALLLTAPFVIALSHR